MLVTDSRMLCSLPRSCLVHPVDRFDSEGWFSFDQVIFLTVFIFLVKKHASFRWKDVISGFPVSPGSAEALIRWGGEIKYILIAYFLGNICAKNCRNRTVHVKIIASCKGGTFLRHGVHLMWQYFLFHLTRHQWCNDTIYDYSRVCKMLQDCLTAWLFPPAVLSTCDIGHEARGWRCRWRCVGDAVGYCVGDSV